MIVKAVKTIPDINFHYALSDLALGLPDHNK